MNANKYHYFRLYENTIVPNKDLVKTVEQYVFSNDSKSLKNLKQYCIQLKYIQLI